MSEEQLKAFLEKVQDDTNLQEKLKAAADSDEVIAIAKEVGFLFSADELTKAQSELAEDELESASGGRCIVTRIRPVTRGIICCMGGKTV